MGGDIGFGGSSGYPVSYSHGLLGYILGIEHTLGASSVADPAFSMAHFPVSNSLSLGAIVAFPMPDPGEAHMSVYIGGGLAVAATGDMARVRTLGYIQEHKSNAMTIRVYKP